MKLETVIGMPPRGVVKPAFGGSITGDLVALG